MIGPCGGIGALLLERSPVFVQVAPRLLQFEPGLAHLGLLKLALGVGHVQLQLEAGHLGLVAALVRLAQALFRELEFRGGNL